MLERKTGKEFRESGLLWFINTTLHVFGWAIAWNSETDEIYPTRTSFRGFDYAHNDNGYRNVTKYLKENIDKLLNDVED